MGVLVPVSRCSPCSVRLYLCLTSCLEEAVYQEVVAAAVVTLVMMMSLDSMRVSDVRAAVDTKPLTIILGTAAAGAVDL